MVMTKSLIAVNNRNSASIGTVALDQGDPVPETAELSHRRPSSPEREAANQCSQGRRWKSWLGTILQQAYNTCSAAPPWSIFVPASGRQVLPTPDFHCTHPKQRTTPGYAGPCLHFRGRLRHRHCCLSSPGAPPPLHAASAPPE